MLMGRIEDDVRGEIVGRVVVEKGGVVEGKVYGSAYIGRDSIIGRNAVVEHHVFIEQSSHIISGSLSRSLVLDNTIIDVNGLRIIDSIMGSHTVIKSSRELRGDAKLIVSDHSQIYL